jgi:hypothetical protein
VPPYIERSLTEPYDCRDRRPGDPPGLSLKLRSAGTKRPGGQVLHPDQYCLRRVSVLYTLREVWRSLITLSSSPGAPGLE